jgi:hypothetical protein
MTRVNVGNDLVAAAVAGDTIGYSGIATASSATSLTATGTPWVASGYIGHIVVVTTTVLAYGVVTANTTSVLTVDRWSVAATPDGTAATTPSATTPFIILPGNAPAFFMALTANSSAAGATDTTLPGEIVTAGLIRKKAAYAHTLGTSVVTLTGAYTSQAADVPVTVAKMGLFTSITGGIMAFETLLNATATLTAVGDPVTVTWTGTV